MTPRKVYVASSWRNKRQPEVVRLIRATGHEVYDFRNPTEGEAGFHWSDIDKAWQSWSAEEYLTALRHPLAVVGFSRDWHAMQWADTFVLVQPCGRSAHLELGWAVGAGKSTAILLEEDIEPELMVKMVNKLCPTMDDVLRWLR